MRELFSCRNCVHNSSQSLTIGQGTGYCLKHDSIIRRPDATTCKYLHRKDLPRFVVDEGIREHAAEFAGFSGLVDMDGNRPIERVAYSERAVWEHGGFDPVVHSLAQYYKTSPGWVFVQAFSGGLDGRRSLTHAGLVRRYMDRCGTWSSSYRLVLALVQEIAVEPQFEERALVGANGESFEDLRVEALWDVVFARISGLQEYGFHAGLESLMWATDSVNGSLSDLNWEGLREELQTRSGEWTEQIIAHARDNKVFFPAPDPEPHDEPPA